MRTLYPFQRVQTGCMGFYCFLFRAEGQGPGLHWAEGCKSLVFRF